MARPLVSIRFALVGLLLTVLLVTVSIVGVSSYLNTQVAVESLADQVLDQTTMRIDQHVQRVLGKTRSLSQSFDNLFGAGRLDPDDCVELTPFMLEILRANGELSYVSYGLENGEYCHVQRENSGRLLVQHILQAPSGHKVLTDFIPRAEGRLETISVDPETTRDPRVRPYYKAARERGSAVWVQTYVFLGRSGVLDIPGVSYATPIYAGDDTLNGVMTIDFDFNALSRYLRLVPVGHNGFGFVVELREDTGDWRVIAHPDPLRLTQLREGRNDAVTIHTIEDPIVQSFARAAPATSSITDALTQFEFESGDDVYIAAVRRLSADGESHPNWLVCIVLPRSDFMAPVTRMNTVTIITGLVGVVLALLLGLFFSRSLVLSIRFHGEDMQRITQLDLSDDGPPPPPTAIRELRDMQLAQSTMKQALGAFSRYVPRDVVRDLLDSEQGAELGAEVRELTVVFTDIAGFTPLVESTPPELMLETLADYLDHMNAAIATHEGTVCQYLGDAIMALWGAPRLQSDHARRACRGALAMRKHVRALIAAAPDKGMPALPTRFGINSGPVMVGNIGAHERFNYAALGDPVNTAARIEGLNKIYGTDILVGERTAELAGDEFVLRPVDYVRMKGKARPLLVYELMGEASGVSDAEQRAVESYRDALQRYRDGAFSEAMARFVQALEAFGGEDTPSTLMMERCERCMKTPPEDWDGIFVMTTK